MIGKPWTVYQMKEEIDLGLHVSALQLVEMKILAKEVSDNEKKGQCKVFLWGSIKENPPE